MTGLIIRKMITPKHFIEFETPYYANYNPIFITCKFDFGRKFNIRPVTFSRISRKIHVCIWALAKQYSSFMYPIAAS